MLTIYLFCLGLGGVLLATTFFGGDHDAPDDFGDFGHGHWQELFSLRNLTYFLFVFGAVGSLLSWYRGGRPGIFDLVLASATGLLVATIVHFTFRYIRDTDTADVSSDTKLLGRAALVTLPVGANGPGKIELSYGGQRVELLARLFERKDGTPDEIANGTEVVIVEMVAGTALVSRTSTEAN